MRKEIIKYQWTDKQWTETLEILANLKKVVYDETIWGQFHNAKTHEKHEVRCKLEGIIRRVKEMRKITEEY